MLSAPLRVAKSIHDRNDRLNYRTVDMAHKHTSDAHLGQSAASLVADGEKIGATMGNDTLCTVD
jgi:hypothetical protein